MNEPKLYDIFKKSFVFLPSAGARYAPELLILELFRELFYQYQYDNSNPKNKKANTALKPGLNPDLFVDRNERILLQVFKGRKKRISQQGGEYYAPPYPSLARKAWFGANRERIIKNFLLEGPLAQYFSSKPGQSQEKNDFIDAFVEALVGQYSYISGVAGKESRKGSEILSLLVNSSTDEFDYNKGIDIAKDKLGKYLSKNSEQQESDVGDLIDNVEDTFAATIFYDVITLCKLEKIIPRIQWIYVFMTFLRFATPMWMLAQMQITSLIHGWVINAIDSGTPISDQDIIKAIQNRNRGLLHPTTIQTRELQDRIERYIKHRVELNFLIELLERIEPASNIGKKQLTVSREGSSYITIAKFLDKVRNLRNAIKNDDDFSRFSPCGNISQYLARKGEGYAAWRNPLQKGQGKNIDEFFRALYKDTAGDEMGGYLLTPKGRGINRGFLVFPGQLLLKLVAYLAYASKGYSMLLLEDIENHFNKYGIDFYSAADSRPMLISELQNMGLLKGSPDAGNSVTVSTPFDRPEREAR